jgi:hypothetical protein
MFPLRFLVVAVLVFSLPGCVFRKGGSAKAAAPASQVPAPAAAKPDGPLSVPQTRVDLPPPQPLDPAALKVEAPPPPEPVETVPPAKPPRSRPTPAATGPTPQPQPEPALPQPQSPVAEERPRIQEIIPPEERKRLMDEINNRKREVNDIFGDVSKRSLSAQERDAVDRVRGFVLQCDQAAERGDLRQAKELCERGLGLARGLKSAR